MADDSHKLSLLSHIAIEVGATLYILGVLWLGLFVSPWAAGAAFALPAFLISVRFFYSAARRWATFSSRARVWVATGVVGLTLLWAIIAAIVIALVW